MSETQKPQKCRHPKDHFWAWAWFAVSMDLMFLVILQTGRVEGWWG